MTNDLKFQAEVIEVKSRKTASLDVGYRLILQTDDPTILTLGQLNGDTLIDVEVSTSE